MLLFHGNPDRREAAGTFEEVKTAMKKLVITRYITNLPELMGGSEPNVDPTKLDTFATNGKIIDDVLMYTLDHVDSPFMIRKEDEGILLRIKDTVSGPLLVYMDEPWAVKAMQAHLGVGSMHIGVTSDGKATGLAFLMIADSDARYDSATEFIKKKLHRAHAAKPHSDDEEIPYYGTRRP